MLLSPGAINAGAGDDTLLVAIAYLSTGNLVFNITSGNKKPLDFPPRVLGSE